MLEIKESLSMSSTGNISLEPQSTDSIGVDSLSVVADFELTSGRGGPFIFGDLEGVLSVLIGDWSTLPSRL